jgi:hypothetical protein
VICSFGIEKSTNADYPDDKNNIKGFQTSGENVAYNKQSDCASLGKRRDIF